MSIEDLDSIVVTKTSGEVVCIIGMDDKHVCNNGYKINPCREEPEFKTVDGVIHLVEN